MVSKETVEMIEMVDTNRNHSKQAREIKQTRPCTDAVMVTAKWLWSPSQSQLCLNRGEGEIRGQSARRFDFGTTMNNQNYPKVRL